jgi:class 3 adenylate cyclase
MNKKAFQLLRKNREIQKPIIEAFGGQWIKELGDGVMASFPTVSNAVYAALKIHEACAAANQFLLRIGIHQGEVVFEDGDIFRGRSQYRLALAIPGSSCRDFCFRICPS